MVGDPSDAPETPYTVAAFSVGDWTAHTPETWQEFYENFHANVGLNPGEIVAVPADLPDPENWEVLNPLWDVWQPSWPFHIGSQTRFICRPINKENDG